MGRIMLAVGLVVIFALWCSCSGDKGKGEDCFGGYGCREGLECIGGKCQDRADWVVKKPKKKPKPPFPFTEETFIQNIKAKAQAEGLRGVVYRIEHGQVKVTRIDKDYAKLEINIPKDEKVNPALALATIRGATIPYVKLSIKVLMENGINPREKNMLVVVRAYRQEGKGLTGANLVRVLGKAYYDVNIDGVKFELGKI